MRTNQTLHEKSGTDFNPKSATVAFASFAIICMAVLFALTVSGVVEIEGLLSMEQPLKQLWLIGIATVALLLFGCLLTQVTPAHMIDETNKGYQDLSVGTLVLFLLAASLFEELLFRGILQNLLLVYSGNEGIAVAISTLLFLSIHVQYFKKPLMLLNITLPSVAFGWLYALTHNLMVPISVHFFMNLGMTLMFKYNLVQLKLK